jgi:uncharacterized protein YpuA (DUF1002 family)
MIMDFATIINIAKGIPQEKWTDEETIKEVIHEAATESGRTYTEEEMNQFVQMFKEFMKDRSVGSMLPLLLKRGVGKAKFDEIIRQVKSDK